jgi:hypothetical protein
MSLNIGIPESIDELLNKCDLRVIGHVRKLEEALASQEPVAWTKIDDTGFVNKPYRAKANAELHYGKDNLTPLYTSPQVPDLQDAERLRETILKILDDCESKPRNYRFKVMRHAIDQAMKGKG